MRATEAIQANASRIEEERARVEALVEEATSLVHGVTADHIAKAYADRATTTMRAAQRWTGAAIALALMAAGWGAYVAYHALTTPAGTTDVVERALVSVPTLIVAGYLASIAASNRRMGWHWRHIELQIRTAEPFIAHLDESTRNGLLAALAIRFFPGQGQDPQHSTGTNESLNLSDLIGQFLHGLSPGPSRSGGP